MGDIANMMLDGTMCQQCGEYLGTDNGYPTTCAGCGGDELGLNLENVDRKDLGILSFGQKKRRNKAIRKIVKAKLKGMSTQKMANTVSDHLSKMTGRELNRLIMETPVLREVFHEHEL